MSSGLDEDDVKAVVVLKDNSKVSAEALWTFW
jgi:hypothetical protein